MGSGGFSGAGELQAAPAQVSSAGNAPARPSPRGSAAGSPRSPSTRSVPQADTPAQHPLPAGCAWPAPGLFNPLSITEPSQRLSPRVAPCESNTRRSFASLGAFQQQSLFSRLSLAFILSTTGGRRARTQTSRRAGLFVRPDRALPAPRN